MVLHLQLFYDVCKYKVPKKEPKKKNTADELVSSPKPKEEEESRLLHFPGAPAARPAHLAPRSGHSLAYTMRAAAHGAGFRAAQAPHQAPRCLHPPLATAARRRRPAPVCTCRPRAVVRFCSVKTARPGPAGRGRGHRACRAQVFCCIRPGSLPSLTAGRATGPTPSKDGFHRSARAHARCAMTGTPT